MPRIETEEQREARHRREAAYRARKRAADPEGFRAKGNSNARRYRRLHPERVKAATKKWRAENKPAWNAMRRAWRSKNLLHALVVEARSRAKARGVAFSITLGDVPPIGDRCPLLGHPFPLPDVRRTAFSPSLDRIDPARGYVPGNVWVVGRRANMVKNDGTAEEHEAIAKAMRAALW